MIKNHAINLYSEVIKFVKIVLEELPEEKMNEPIGKGEKPADILYHMIATPHWWMKQSGKPLPFSAKFSNLSEVSILLDKQLEVFKELIEKEGELVWTDQSYSSKQKSVAWIMIRTANHMMHHASMLIYIRHIWGLQALKNSNWAKVVDLSGNIHY